MKFGQDHLSKPQWLKSLAFYCLQEQMTMRRMSVLLCLLLLGMQAFSQQSTATCYGFMKGTIIKGKWHYRQVQKVNTVIHFTTQKITIKDSSTIDTYRLLKDVLTKRIDKDGCIASLRTGYDKDNIRCMINVLEFDNGRNVLNILYNNISYSYYFRQIDN